MAAGGWGAGAVYDRYGFYAPAFGLGILFNVLNLAVLGVLYLTMTRRAGRQPSRIYQRA
jgi:hypothetical protein